MRVPSTGASVILWSVISAAFIGPGTITTAASAGSAYHLDLLWAVVFATAGCIILQELSARLVIGSGLTFGEALDKKFSPRTSMLLKYFAGGSVILGCAAYEAGNILGAVAGINLLTGFSILSLTIIITFLCAIILWTGKREMIGYLMTFLVALMGVAFFILAVRQPVGLYDLLVSSVVPQIPKGSELLALGLVGTTIVPYNLFLGSAISKGQTIPLMRIGLTISVFIGGLITAAILIAGTSVKSFSSFSELADALTQKLGPVGGIALSVGLFAAGFSSAITSPYAASLIASHIFDWQRNRQRLVWLAVLATGFGFGVSGVKPIPVILAVQALNGLILPLITAVLILLTADEGIVTPLHRNRPWYSVVLLLIFGVVLFMGLGNIGKSVSSLFGLTGNHFPLMAGATVMIVLLLGVVVFWRKGKKGL